MLEILQELAGLNPEQAGYTIPAQPVPVATVPAQVPQGGFGLLGSLFGGQRQPTQGFEGIPQREAPTWREKISTILSPALMQIGAALMSPPAQRAAILGNLGSVVQAGQKTLADDRLYRAQLAAWQKANTQQARSPSEVELYLANPEAFADYWQRRKPLHENAPKLQKYYDESGRERMGYWNGTEMVPYGGAKAKEPKEFAPQWQTYVNSQDPTDIITIPKEEPPPSGYTLPTLVQKPTKEPSELEKQRNQRAEDSYNLRLYNTYTAEDNPVRKKELGDELIARGAPVEERGGILNWLAPSVFPKTQIIGLPSSKKTAGLPAATAQQPISREEALAELRRRGVIK